jgi:hypothetical protein
VRGIRGIAGVTATAAIVAGGLVAGCGGGERQDADEPEGTYKVDVVDAEFPLAQRLAKAETLTIRVRNADSKKIPNVAVTVDSFTTASKQEGLADPQRPVWIVDDGPRGGTTAYTNTWALGEIPPGQERTFAWKVTAIKSGEYTVKYRVSAGLDGKAKAQLGDGGVPEGSFKVSIADTPPAATVDPETGRVIRSSK